MVCINWYTNCDLVWINTKLKLTFIYIDVIHVYVYSIIKCYTEIKQLGLSEGEKNDDSLQH